jgi:hypothetical protein
VAERRPPVSTVRVRGCFALGVMALIVVLSIAVA